MLSLPRTAQVVTVTAKSLIRKHSRLLEWSGETQAEGRSVICLSNPSSPGVASWAPTWPFGVHFLVDLTGPRAYARVR